MRSYNKNLDLLNNPLVVNLDLLLIGNGLSGMDSCSKYCHLTNKNQKNNKNNMVSRASTISLSDMDSDSITSNSSSMGNTFDDDSETTSSVTSNNNVAIKDSKCVSSHVYWDGINTWTSYNDSNNDPYFHNNNWNNLCSNNKCNPLLSVIKPNTFKNINNLSYFNKYVKNNPNNCYNINNNKKIAIGSFKNYIFMAQLFTNQLKKLIDKNMTLVDINRIYQFEIRYFQHCLLNGNVSFIKLNGNKNGWNHNSQYNEYLIWRFCHQCSSKFNYEPIYGIACPNMNSNINMHNKNYQPWYCVSIQKQSTVLNYFHLKNVFGTKKEREILLSLLPQSLKCHHVEFNPTFEFESNHSRIGKLLNKGYDKYLAEERKKRVRVHAPRSAYYCMSMRNAYASTSTMGGTNHNINNNNNNKKGKKLSNQDKFEYLEYLANVKLKIKFEQLTEMIVNAIDKAFLFGQKYPHTVLTQSYIDEENQNVVFENVLLLEIYDIYNNNITYKFGIPIEMKETMKNSYKYVAKTILTPQMAIENIMLNAQNEINNNNNNNNNYNNNGYGSWIYDMTNNDSFYKKLN